MFRWSLVSILLLVVGCGSGVGGTGSTARTLCTNNGVNPDESFDRIQGFRDDGLTRTEAQDLADRACVISCADDDTCGTACVACTSAIVAEVY